MILGIDEVGRGPWAGPLVVGAVVLGGETIEGLTDSKKLSKKRREAFDVIIRKQAAGYGLGWVDASELDEIGLPAALRLATKRAVEQISTPYHEIIIDGTINFLANTSKADYVKTMPKADLLIPSVSAASIIAKVARDTYMAEQDSIYGGYNFASHVGYGTAAHVAAIEKNGVTPLHRLSFAPLEKYRKKPASQAIRHQDGSSQDSTKDQSLDRTLAADVRGAEQPGRHATPSNHMGLLAEEETANYLSRNGHRIVERNWKTKYCEIDIVSVKNEVVYFTEVKYRKQSNQGGGLAAITPKKLQQMKFAATFYEHSHNIKNMDLLLAAATLTGEPASLEEWFVIT
jgi:ribonuclease HII